MAFFRFGKSYWERRARQDAALREAGINRGFSEKDAANYKAAVAGGHINPSELSDEVRSYVSQSTDPAVSQSAAPATTGGQAGLGEIDGQQITPEMMQQGIDRLMNNPNLTNEQRTQDILAQAERYGISDEQLAQNTNLTAANVAEGRQYYNTLPPEQRVLPTLQPRSTLLRPEVDIFLFPIR